MDGDISRFSPISYLYDTLTSFKKKVEKITDIYALFLDFTLLNILERIVTSPIIHNAILLKDYPEMRAKIFRNEDPLLREHISHMMDLTEYFNTKIAPQSN